MDEMTITSAQYFQFNGANSGIKAIINGTEMLVPLDADNKEYAEILRQVEAGIFTIQDAD